MPIIFRLPGQEEALEFDSLVKAVCSDSVTYQMLIRYVETSCETEIEKSAALAELHAATQVLGAMLKRNEVDALPAGEKLTHLREYLQNHSLAGLHELTGQPVSHFDSAAEDVSYDKRLAGSCATSQGTVTSASTFGMLTTSGETELVDYGAFSTAGGQTMIMLVDEYAHLPTPELNRRMYEHARYTACEAARIMATATTPHEAELASAQIDETIANSEVHMQNLRGEAQYLSPQGCALTLCKTVEERNNTALVHTHSIGDNAAFAYDPVSNKIFVLMEGQQHGDEYREGTFNPISYRDVEQHAARTSLTELPQGSIIFAITDGVSDYFSYEHISEDGRVKTQCLDSEALRNVMQTVRDNNFGNALPHQYGEALMRTAVEKTNVFRAQTAQPCLVLKSIVEAFLPEPITRELINELFQQPREKLLEDYLNELNINLEVYEGVSDDELPEGKRGIIIKKAMDYNCTNPVFNFASSLQSDYIRRNENSTIEALKAFMLLDNGDKIPALEKFLISCYNPSDNVYRLLEEDLKNVKFGDDATLVATEVLQRPVELMRAFAHSYEKVSHLGDGSGHMVAHSAAETESMRIAESLFEDLQQLPVEILVNACKRLENEIAQGVSPIAQSSLDYILLRCYNTEEVPTSTKALQKAIKYQQNEVVFSSLGALFDTTHHPRATTFFQPFTLFHRGERKSDLIIKTIATFGNREMLGLLLTRPAMEANDKHLLFSTALQEGNEATVAELADISSTFHEEMLSAAMQKPSVSLVFHILSSQMDYVLSGEYGIAQLLGVAADNRFQPLIDVISTVNPVLKASPMQIPPITPSQGFSRYLFAMKYFLKQGEAVEVEVVEPAELAARFCEQFFSEKNTLTNEAMSEVMEIIRDSPLSAEIHAVMSQDEYWVDRITNLEARLGEEQSDTATSETDETLTLSADSADGSRSSTPISPRG